MQIWEQRQENAQRRQWGLAAVADRLPVWLSRAKKFDYSWREFEHRIRLRELRHPAADLPNRCIRANTARQKLPLPRRQPVSKMIGSKSTYIDVLKILRRMEFGMAGLLDLVAAQSYHFAADAIRLGFTDSSSPCFVEHMNFEYQQRIARVYEVGTQKPTVTTIAGPAQGTAGMTRIIGPREVMVSFYRKFSPLEVSDGSIQISGRLTGCGSGERAQQSWLMGPSVVANVGGVVASADMLISEEISLKFLALERRAFGV